MYSYRWVAETILDFRLGILAGVMVFTMQFQPLICPLCKLIPIQPEDAAVRSLKRLVREASPMQNPKCKIQNGLTIAILMQKIETIQPDSLS
jgi:hypothetical protein